LRGRTTENIGDRYTHTHTHTDTHRYIITHYTLRITHYIMSTEQQDQTTTAKSSSPSSSPSSPSSSISARRGGKKGQIQQKWERFLHQVNSTSHNNSNNGYNDNRIKNNKSKNNEKDGDNDNDNDNDNNDDDDNIDEEGISIRTTAPQVCGICLESYTAGDEVCLSYNKDCHHVFHKDCILSWLMNGHEDCPNCRQVFLKPI